MNNKCEIIEAVLLDPPTATHISIMLDPNRPQPDAAEARKFILACDEYYKSIFEPYHGISFDEVDVDFYLPSTVHVLDEPL